MNAISKTADFPVSSAVNQRAAVAATKTSEGAGLRTTWSILHWTYGLVPIVAGVDKFTNLLVHWENYLNPALAHILPVSPSAFMGAVGIIEMVAGILVLARPRIGGAIVAAWLTAIALSLIAGGSYFDVAVRDLVMAIGAVTLVRLTPLADKK